MSNTKLRVRLGGAGAGFLLSLFVALCFHCHTLLADATTETTLAPVSDDLSQLVNSTSPGHIKGLFTVRSRSFV